MSWFWRISLTLAVVMIAIDQSASKLVDSLPIELVEQGTSRLAIKVQPDILASVEDVGERAESLCCSFCQSWNDIFYSNSHAIKFLGQALGFVRIYQLRQHRCADFSYVSLSKGGVCKLLDMNKTNELHCKRSKFLSNTAFHELWSYIVRKHEDRMRTPSIEILQHMALKTSIRSKLERMTNEEQISYLTEKAERTSPSLYCFAVVNPMMKNEKQLILASLIVGGLSSCDHVDLFTTPEMMMVDIPDMYHSRVAVVPCLTLSLKTNTSAVTNTALNTPIFQQVYREIFRRGLYKNYDLVIKVDPDTVVSMNRIRNLFGNQTLGIPKVWRNSHWYFGNYTEDHMGLHGPIMVMTPAALSRYQKSITICESINISTMGEDWYLAACFDALNVTFENLENQLTELNWFRKIPKLRGRANCISKTVAAFHPLKSLDGYFKCWLEMKLQTRYIDVTRARRRAGWSNVPKFFVPRLKRRAIY